MHRNMEKTFGLFRIFCSSKYISSHFQCLHLTNPGWYYYFWYLRGEILKGTRETFKFTGTVYLGYALVWHMN